MIEDGVTPRVLSYLKVDIQNKNESKTQNPNHFIHAVSLLVPNTMLGTGRNKSDTVLSLRSSWSFAGGRQVQGHPQYVVVSVRRELCIAHQWMRRRRRSNPDFPQRGRTYARSSGSCPGCHRTSQGEEETEKFRKAGRLSLSGTQGPCCWVTRADTGGKQD